MQSINTTGNNSHIRLHLELDVSTVKLLYNIVYSSINANLLDIDFRRFRQNENLSAKLKILYESILDKESINVRIDGFLLALLASCKTH